MKKINYYEICNQKLKYLNYSDKSIKSYLFYINQFLENTIIPPTRLTSNDFQSYLDTYNFTSVSQQNQVINAKENLDVVPHTKSHSSSPSGFT